MNKTKNFPHFLWIAPLFLFSRILFLFFAKPRYLFFDKTDELYRGAIANEILNGLHHPLFHYLADDYGGGSIGIALIISLFFKVLGPNVLALKLAPLLFSFLALFFWYKIICRHNTTRTANIFALLFIFAPFGFFQYSLAALGDHNDTLFFTVLSLFFYTNLVQKTTSQTGRSFRTVQSALFALSAGIGLWYDYSYGVSLFALALYDLFTARELVRPKRLVVTLPAFLLGFSPWIYYNLITNFSGLIIYDQPLSYHFQGAHLLQVLDVPEKFSGYTVFRSLFNDLSMRSPSPRGLHYPYILFLLVCIGFPLISKSYLKNKNESRFLLLFSITFLVLFGLIVELSSFRKLNYMIIAHPFIFFLAAYGLNSMRTPISRTILGFLILGVGIISNIYALEKSPPKNLFKEKGYSYEYSADAFVFSHFHPCRELKSCFSEYERLRKTLSEEDFKKFSDGLSSRIVEELTDEPLPPAEIERRISEVRALSPEHFKRNYLEKTKQEALSFS